MLTGLSIRDIVLIDRLDLEFQPALTALTGETGAGKSILLDALGLALGMRADAGLVRAGAEQAVVAATFEIEPRHPLRVRLADQGIEADGPLILRRTLARDGRSRAFVNDQPVAVGLMREIGGALVEVQGQFEQRGLIDAATHRALLDAFGGPALAECAAAAGAGWARWRELDAQKRAAAEAGVRADADEAFLRHAVGEIDALDPKPEEEESLARDRALLMNREKLMQALGDAMKQLAGDRAAEHGIAGARRALDRAAPQAGGRLDAPIAALDRAATELADAIAQLQALGADDDLDPARLEKIEERLFALKGLARKHRVEVKELPRLRQDLAQRLAAIDDRAGAVERLTKDAAAARAAYLAAAEQLSALRRAAAAKLDKAVASELPPLKLERAAFATVIARAEEPDWSAHGIDRVRFEAATNPGQPPGPLNKIASGGELSRFMLALKVVLAKADPVPTLVFDEVDSGIGGATADAVGERLARLARDVQILVVTHSPQVAARARQQMRVTKAAAKGATVTRVDALAAADRREEIARMLSGAAITDEARAAAGRLIDAGAPKTAKR
jgi:DNA repair protein RecN (Recombination protein N)